MPQAEKLGRYSQIFLRSSLQGLDILTKTAMFWLGSYVASPRLAVVPQSGAKDQFYCSCLPHNVNLNCKTQKVSENGKNCRRYLALVLKIS
jgi:hypothetical protein